MEGFRFPYTNFVLKTSYKSPEPEEELSEEKYQKLLVQDLGVPQEHFSIHFDEDKNKSLVSCVPCNKTIGKTTEYTIQKHFQSKEHENRLSKTLVPPKKQASPPVENRKRPRREEEDDSLDELFEQRLEERIERECVVKMKDKKYINSLIEDNSGIFDDMFQQRQVDKLLARRLDRIMNK